MLRYPGLGLEAAARAGASSRVQGGIVEQRLRRRTVRIGPRSAGGDAVRAIAHRPAGGDRGVGPRRYPPGRTCGRGGGAIVVQPIPVVRGRCRRFTRRQRVDRCQPTRRLTGQAGGHCGRSGMRRAGRAGRRKRARYRGVAPPRGRRRLEPLGLRGLRVDGRDRRARGGRRPIGTGLLLGGGGGATIRSVRGTARTIPYQANCANRHHDRCREQHQWKSIHQRNHIERHASDRKGSVPKCDVRYGNRDKEDNWGLYDGGEQCAMSHGQGRDGTSEHIDHGKSGGEFSTPDEMVDDDSENRSQNTDGNRSPGRHAVDGRQRRLFVHRDG